VTTLNKVDIGIVGKYLSLEGLGNIYVGYVSFLVPRRIRLLMAVGAMVTLALMAFLIAINLHLYVAALSLVGLVIGAWGIYLQIKKGAYCLYCLTTDAILLILFGLSIIKVI